MFTIFNISLANQTSPFACEGLARETKILLISLWEVIIDICISGT
jgi:hypothetical protein